MATESLSDTQTTALLRNLITALEDKKADHLKVLYVGGISDITDFLVLATGNSETHLRALRIEAERIFDAAKSPLAGTDQGGFGSGWTVLDAYQIMVHFFTAEQRENYALDKLWKDASTVDLKTFAIPARVAVVKAPKVKKEAKIKVAKKPVRAPKKAVKTKGSKAPAKKPVAKPARKSTSRRAG